GHFTLSACLDLIHRFVRRLRSGIGGDLSRESPRPRSPCRAPLATPGVKIRRYAPIIGRAKGAVRQRKLGQSVRAEEVRSAKSMNLMKHVPNAMQEVTDDEQEWYSDTHKPENSKQNDSHCLHSQPFFVCEIGGEREVKCRDCDEKQGKKDLFCFCRE